MAARRVAGHVAGGVCGGVGWGGVGHAPVVRRIRTEDERKWVSSAPGSPREDLATDVDKISTLLAATGVSSHSFPLFQGTIFVVVVVVMMIPMISAGLCRGRALETWVAAVVAGAASPPSLVAAWSVSSSNRHDHSAVARLHTPPLSSAPCWKDWQLQAGLASPAPPSPPG